MIEIILKDNIEKRKMDALLNFLRSWNIDVEMRKIDSGTKKKTEFSLSAGIWKENDIDSDELRKKAWKLKR